MDLPTLLTWCNTCNINYAHATAALKRTLTRNINQFLSQPIVLLDVISRYGAAIGGEVALAFVRRHQPVQPRTLEIFVGASLHGAFCAELLSDNRVIPDVVGTAVAASRYPYILERDVLKTVQINLRGGQSIYIRQSSTLSPLSPIARSICTAMVNFVTPHSFGCAYPALTLDDKSLVSDIRQNSMSDFDVRLMQTLAEQHIDSASDPASWPQYRTWSPTPAVPDTTKACWRSHFICPEQGRFFGDHGSLVGFVDPLGMPAATLQERGAPPFGTAVVWRLSPTYRCPLSCETHDSTLPVGQTSTAVILIRDPFAPRRRGRNTARSVRYNTLLPTSSVNATRRRSSSI